MKKIYTLISAIFFSALQAEVRENPKNQAIFFQENKGQICDQNYKPRPDVLFSGVANGMVYHLTNTGISYQLSKVETWTEVTEGKSKKELKVPDKTSIYRVDVKWLGVNENAPIEKGNALEGVSNYYLQQCPDGALDVKNYSTLKYKNIYNGIDLKWYEKDGDLEYDFIVSPNADVTQIKLQINGAKKLCINKKGELEITTPSGTITEKAPIAYQDDKIIKTKWKLINNELQFSLSEYSHSKILVIDPVVRLWGTYYGGAGIEYITEVKTDAAGNSYLAGATSNLSIGTTIATSGGYQTTYAGGTYDAFLVKMNSSGVRQWATYYGGNGDDQGNSTAVDGASTPGVYLAGTTTSTGTSLSTLGAHQVTNAGSFDAFLVKFNSSNGARLWGTYYGHSGITNGYSCDTDNLNNVILAGSTTTVTAPSTIIATPGSHQPTQGGTGNASDGFLVKFNSVGVRQWGTYYGANGRDDIYSCHINKGTNEIVVAGSTFSGSSISSVGAYMTLYPGAGFASGFVAKFAPAGNRLWGTYYGGSGNNNSFNSCRINSTGEVYAFGTFYSAGLATIGSHQPTKTGSNESAFLIKFNSAGSTVTWATYYDGTNGATGDECDLDNAQNIFICGETNSSGNIATVGSHQSSYTSGTGYKGYLAMFNPLGVRQWGTYYGGDNNELVYSCSSDGFGNIYLCGATQSTVSVSTVGSHQTSYGGALYDGFLAKFINCSNTLTLNIVGTSTICSGSTTTLTASGTGFTTYTWSSGPTTSSAAISPSITTTYTLIAGTSTAGCIYSAVKTVSVNLCTGFTELQTRDPYLQVNPNPNNGHFKIIVPEEGNYSIVNSLGQIVKEIKIETEVEVSTIDLAEGIYYVIGKSSKAKIVVSK